MRLLELFSGTNSVGKEFPGEVVSLDIVGRPTHKTDILEWDYTNGEKYLPGHFDMIWASPPCTQYSSARVKANTPRDLVGADSLVNQVLVIIDYFQPGYWFIENPWGGMLRRRSVVSMLPAPKKVSYCKYGAPYQKKQLYGQTQILNLNAATAIAVLWFLEVVGGNGTKEQHCVDPANTGHEVILYQNFTRYHPFFAVTSASI